ncbi:MAG: hypothetical protein KatS3mg123_3176 [Burkholderiales bacterium]|nr:MAG: hypothetical protein KatS3mg123_3176 [Burkholderiales bacterium]
MGYASFLVSTALVDRMLTVPSGFSSVSSIAALLAAAERASRRAPLPAGIRP